MYDNYNLNESTVCSRSGLMEIKGRFSTAKIFTNLIEEAAMAQIKTLCDQPFTENCSIAVMPDVHSGSGCVIGFTADLGELVIPNIVGVDIGCGMLTVCLGKLEPDFAALDAVIRSYVPSGRNTNESPICEFEALSELYCFQNLRNVDRIRCSIGTLGSGNHFIEIDRDEEGLYYLVIHTGSRNLGKQVAEYYQELAVSKLRGKVKLADLRRQIIKEYIAAGKENEINTALNNLKLEYPEAEIPRDLCYLTGTDRDKYLHDMKLCQEFAILNRRTIAVEILSNWLGTELDSFEYFETIHNYIDHKSNIIRKGAVSAKKGERLIIPINMRDGSLICIGKGNPLWNCSAPHGAGRLFSRSAARKSFSLDEYSHEMKGIYTTSVEEGTLDECPMAYKPMEAIVENIRPTVSIERIIKPVYNFKAAD